MFTLNLSKLTTIEVQNYLQYAISPRPICFASTIDKAGNINLSPYSFFNLFSSNPPIVVFSPARRVRDNSTKHTLQNILEIPEVVINMVDYQMVQQMSLASCDYPKNVNEFEKAGFTQEKATIVSPPMIKESKIKLECKVNQVIPLGKEGGAGNLVIAEILMLHIDESILNAENMIDQAILDMVARLGGDWYTRVNTATTFKVQKTNIHLGIGFDSLPLSVRNSKILTGNELAQLANVNTFPTVDPTFHDDKLKNIIQYFSIHPEEFEMELHMYAKHLIEKDQVAQAWQVLLAAN